MESRTPRRHAALLLATSALVAAATLAACGGDDDSTQGVGLMRTATRPPTATTPPALQLQGLVRGGGAGVLSKRQRAKLRFLEGVIDACDSAGPRVSIPPDLGRARQIVRIGREIRRVDALRVALGRAGRSPLLRRETRDAMDRYRRALERELVLDGIVLRDLRSPDDDSLGVSAAKRQNRHNKQVRDAVADALRIDCLRASKPRSRRRA